ncbi:Glycosyltransferase involved in cell wall bisynthesis [Actinacidiphila yanglinensis]|uniref:Glycosyltransferase involved in cell wall bisynthesis n=1 Tax=Actinacidiphila yanglinensis TaxID=310779 RepID=A0A1H5SXH2_9ACTN|nr:Glycosyltransferase involved in cell wall bisynthesis [Actinacidiphila yanglinensis]
MASTGRRRRLLLVSTNYAPEHAGIGPYATQIAEHWAAGGAEVHVLTGMPHYPAWKLDPAYVGVPRVEEERAGVRLHRRGHAVPARQTALSRAAFEASVLRGGRDEPAGMGRPDAVFAQMPSLAGGVLAARLAERHQVPFVPIVQDLMGAAAAQSGIRGGGPAALAAGLVEKYALRRAALVGVIHESFAAKVAAMGVPRERIRVVPNWSHVRRPSRPREEMRARLGWRPGQTVLLHSGNMGLKQGLEVLVETARSSPETRVVLMGDGNQREQLRTLAGGLPNLDFLAPAADEEFADVLAAADFLLVTQRASVRDMSLPSKLTSYFAAGRPVIASVAEDSGTAQEVVRSGAGVVVAPESAAELLAAVRALTADTARAAVLAAAGPVYVDAHLSREAGLARMDALLSEVLADGAAPAPEGAVTAPDETPSAPAEPPEPASEGVPGAAATESEAAPAPEGPPAVTGAEPVTEAAPEPESAEPKVPAEPPAEPPTVPAASPASSSAADAPGAPSRPSVPPKATATPSPPRPVAPPQPAAPPRPAAPPLPPAPPRAAEGTEGARPAADPEPEAREVEEPAAGIEGTTTAEPSAAARTEPVAPEEPDTGEAAGGAPAEGATESADTATPADPGAVPVGEPDAGQAGEEAPADAEGAEPPSGDADPEGGGAVRAQEDGGKK